MRGVVYHGPHQVEVADDLPMPRLRSERDAVMRVTRAAICGSDLHPYRGEFPGFLPGTVLGHEFAGVVVDAGAEVPFGDGDRVFASDLVACGRCRRCALGWHYHCPDATLFGYSTVVGEAVDGGQAEFVRIPYADVVLARTPDELTDEQMLFAGDVLATAYTAITEAEIKPGDVVGVVGAGPVGLTSGLCALDAGASAVVVSDVHEARREVAVRLGLRAVEPDAFERALAQTAGTGEVHAVIEAVGNQDALRCAVAAAGPRGIVVVVGAHGADAMAFPADRAFVRELTVRFAVGDPIRSRDPVVSLLRTGRIDPTVLVSHRLPLSEAVRGYELFDSRAAFKVVLITDEDTGEAVTSS